MKRITAFSVAFLFLLACTGLHVGCGSGEEKAVREAAAEQEEEVAEGVPSGEAPTGGGEVTGGERAGEEPPAGYLYERQEIGSPSPLEYLQLVDVRWADHADYFRVVAELKRLDGTDAVNVPWCFADYSEDPTIEPGTEIHLYIRGIRREDNHATSLQAGEGTLTGDEVCYQILMTQFGSVDGVEPVNLFVSTRERRPFRLSYATSPLRIILDIWR